MTCRRRWPRRGGELPPNLPFKPTYRKVNPADAPIMILSLTSETVPLSQVFDAATTILAQKISQIHGVGQVTVGGGQQPAVRVRVDSVALAGMGLAMEDVRDVLAKSTADQPKGTLSRTDADQHHRRQRPALRRRPLQGAAASPTSTAPRCS